MMKSKILSILLILTLVLSILPIQSAYAAPVSFTVTVSNHNGYTVYVRGNVTLSWTNASSAGETIFYKVERSVTRTEDGFTNFVLLKPCLTVLTYTDNTVASLPEGTLFCYRITADDGKNTITVYSEPLCTYVDPPAFSLPVLMNPQVSLGGTIRISIGRLLDSLPLGVNPYIQTAQIQAQRDDGTYAGSASGEGIIGEATADDIYYGSILELPAGDWATTGSRWRFWFRYVDTLGNVGSWSEPTEYVTITEGQSPVPEVTLDENSATVDLLGVVEPAILSAEVTVSACFVINPNAEPGSQFISPELTVTNTSTMPIEVYAQSMKATGTAPKVVAWDQYTQEQWDALGTDDTYTQMALGLTGTASGDFWFPAEELQIDAFPVAGLGSQECINLGLQCKHGLSWVETENFRYELVFLITMRD